MFTRFHPHPSLFVRLRWLGFLFSRAAVAAEDSASAAPSGAQMAGAAATVMDEEFGSLGPGVVSGSLSADGVPDVMLALLGEGGIVRQVCR